MKKTRKSSSNYITINHGQFTILNSSFENFFFYEFAFSRSDFFNRSNEEITYEKFIIITIRYKNYFRMENFKIQNRV